MERIDTPSSPGRGRFPLSAGIVVALLAALGLAFVFPGCFR